MNNKSSRLFAIRSFPSLALRTWSYALLAVAGLTATQRVQAASQTWTNAPADATWTNVNNWIGHAVPGDINNTAANTVNADIVTFSNAIVGGIGSIANPIVPDDATVVNGRSRRICGIVFDSPNCGAYYISTLSPMTLPAGVPATGILYVSHNTGTNAFGGALGAIRINDSVPNSQVIAVPMLVNLPSSTAGIYNLINNSTNPGVTLTINSLTHDGATTRGTTYVLDGTNTEANVITNLSEGPSAGTGANAGGITKQGPGTWILAGPGTFINASVIAVNQGTLIVRDPGSFGTVVTTVITVITNGVLQIDGVTLNQNAITLGNGGLVRMNGVATVNGITVPNVVGSSATLATKNATDVMTVANAANRVTGGSASSILHITGPGTVAIAQPNNYIGNWTVDSGTNQLLVAGALGTGPNLNVNAGAVFDISPMGGTVYTLDTKAFSANGTGTAVGSTAADVMADPAGTIDFASKPLTLTFTPTAFTGDTGHPALNCSQGILSFHGNQITVNNASGTPLGVGTYQLVHQATGSIVSSGAFVALISGSGLGAGLIPEIVAVGGNLNLVVTAYTPKPLVWVGNDPTLPGQWDRQISVNWLAGATPSTFNIYDGVTFNATGSAAPVVTMAGTMQPSSVFVDTSANTYTFTGTGDAQIAGGTSLVKINTAGKLILQTANTYSGGTIISNGVVQLGADNGISSTGPTGTNDVTLLAPAVFDLNNFSDTINGLNGGGTVDITGGGSSVLTIGFNGDGGLFTGLLKNTSGTLGLFKTGTGVETLTASNTYVGPTTVDAGTLRVTNMYALGAGYSPVTINNGTLDMQTSLLVTNLNGTGGLVINSSAFTNTLTITSNSTYSGIIAGKISVLVNGGTLRLNGVNTYSNGTIVAANAGLAIGGGAANAGTGGVIASNNTTMSMPNTASASSAPANSFTTVDGATVTFISSATANTWAGQFNGSATATNIFANGNMSISGALSFSNFVGRVIITNGEVRWFNAASGGDNTVFDFEGTGGCFARDAVDIIHLGALIGNGQITAPSVSFPATYWIGGKNLDTEFSGTISGSNNIVKGGTGRLTLDGAPFTLNTDAATFTNIIYTGSGITFINNTTISNGVLALSSPNDLTASPNIILATSNAILDTVNMGYVSNYTDVNLNAASFLATNGIMTVVASTAIGGIPQLLGGAGLVRGNGVINNGTINPGQTNSAGTLTISNSLTINAGATTAFDLSDDPSGVVAASDLLKVQGSVILSGNSTIAINGLNGVLNPGKYPLIKYSGSLMNEGGVVPSGLISNFALGGLFPTTSRATLLLSNAPGEVDLVVVSLNTTNLVWQGDGNSNFWDVVTSFNWSDGGGPSQFYQLDNVNFNSTTTNALVLVQGTVAPGSILVTGATNYIFAGPGNIIGDGTLTMSGTGSLLLTNAANSYTGGTVINSGVVRVGLESGGSQNDLVLGTGPVTVNATAELRFGGNGGGVVNHFVSNNIVVNGGIVKAYDGVQHLTNSTVTVNAGGASFQTVFSTKNLVLDSPLAGAGPLTVASGTNIASGQVVLTYGTNSFSGSVAVATNANLALIGLAGLSNSTSLDIQQGGIFDVSARSNAAWSVLSGQTLKGNGVIRGKLITAAAGSTVAPGIAGAIGTLSVTNQGNTTNFAVVTLAGTTSIDINRGATPNADRILNANGTNVMGGTLTVNNLGAALVAGDTFQVLVGATNTGAFSVINLPTLTGALIWTNTLALNGRLTVVSPIIIPTIPPGITNFSLVGANVVISGTNAQTGATYYLITTTNLTFPLTQWRTVSTNVLGAANYTFVGTNAAPAKLPQQYYRLSSTNFNP